VIYNVNRAIYYVSTCVNTCSSPPLLWRGLLLGVLLKVPAGTMVQSHKRQHMQQRGTTAVEGAAVGGCFSRYLQGQKYLYTVA
jgi:hypothetical protein